jgi:hypothetical protein
MLPFGWFMSGGAHTAGRSKYLLLSRKGLKNKFQPISFNILHSHILRFQWRSITEPAFGKPLWGSF